MHRSLWSVFGLAVLGLAVLGFGCRDKDGGAKTSTDPAGDSGTAADTAPSTDTALSQPALTMPPEATDLDEADGSVHVALTAAATTHTILDWTTGEIIEVEGYAYDGTTPGPTIRAQLGDTITIDLTNALDAPTTIHWHGVDVPWDMDGVTWMQDPIAAGESFTYQFTAKQAGTYWYHPHFDTAHQVDRGLYGVLVIEDPADPTPDRELVLVLDDWSASESHDTAEADWRHGDTSHVHGESGRDGTWTVNGLVQPVVAVDGGERIRVRIVNASNQGYRALTVPDMTVIARDQGLLPEPMQPDSEILSPGDRVELELRPAAEGFSLDADPYSLMGGVGMGEPEALLDVAIDTTGDAGAALDYPFTGSAVSEDPGTTDVLYTFQGDSHSETWMINGELYPDVTVAEVGLDQTVVIEVRNLSDTEHPFHLHGHRFEVLSTDGVAPEVQAIEDTINLPMHQAMRLLLTADNPGDWMAHCHILPHAHDGMMTVLRVTEE
jgi:FtsP/CotA-like multicopper oxidase with cupredoxin domain